MKGSAGKIWLIVSALLAFVVGAVLLLNDSAAGWFLILTGIVDIGLAAGRLPMVDRGLALWGVVAITCLIVALVLLLVVVLRAV